MMRDVFAICNSKDFYTDIYKRILLTIQFRNIELETFVSDLCLDDNSIQLWHIGKSRNYMVFLPKIASYLTVDVDFLLFGNTKKILTNEYLKKLSPLELDVLKFEINEISPDAVSVLAFANLYNSNDYVSIRKFRNHEFQLILELLNNNGVILTELWNHRFSSDK